MSVLVVLGALALAAVAVNCYVYYRDNRNVYRTLSSRQPERRSDAVPLGMEATDMDLVNKVTRRNEALERGQTSWTRRGMGSLTAVTDTDVDPMADDETYAARYFAAFQKDKKKD